MASWEAPQNSSTLLYMAKFTPDDDQIKQLIEKAEAGAEAGGPLGAAAGVLEALAEGATGSMDLWFQNGRTYTFFAVPYSVYKELLAAGSPGSYYNSNIRGQYAG